MFFIFGLLLGYWARCVHNWFQGNKSLELDDIVIISTLLIILLGIIFTKH